MANSIRVKRGLKANLPALNAGEFGLCTDTGELYIGNSGNKLVSGGAGATVPNPSFDSLYYRTGLKGSTVFGTNTITKTITIVSGGLTLATKKTTFSGAAATIVTTFYARTFPLDGVSITTLAKTDTSTLNFSDLSWQ